MNRQHLAIFVPPFLDLILDSKKTIEGRFSKVKCAPFGVVEPGGTVFMKAVGGHVRGLFVVAKVETFQNLTKEKLHEIERTYSEGLQSNADPLFWESRADKQYATLLQVSNPKVFTKPFPFHKKDRRG